MLNTYFSMPYPYLIEIEEGEFTRRGLPPRIGITLPTHAVFYAFLKSRDISTKALITVFHGKYRSECRKAIITNLPAELKNLPHSAWGTIQNDRVALTIKYNPQLNEIELTEDSLNKLKKFNKSPQVAIDPIQVPKTLEPIKAPIHPIESILKSISYISTQIAKTDKSYSKIHLTIMNVIINLDGTNFEKIELIGKEMQRIQDMKNSPSFFSCFSAQSNEVKAITVADKFISKVAQIEILNEETARDFLMFADLFKSPHLKIFSK